MLFEESEILTSQRRPFTVFTPYARVWRAQKPAAPAGVPRLPPLPAGLDLADGPAARRRERSASRATRRLPTPGEAAAHARLRDFVEDDLTDYAESRDFPGRAGTSGLSPYLRFGAISIRTRPRGDRRPRRRRPRLHDRARLAGLLPAAPLPPPERRAPGLQAGHARARLGERSRRSSPPGSAARPATRSSTPPCVSCARPAGCTTAAA